MGLFQVASMLDLVAYQKDNNSLNRIKEVRPAYIYQSIPFRIEKSSICLFLTEVCKKSIKEHEANDDLYTFLESSLLKLDQSERMNNYFHIQFLLRLTQYLGIRPDNNWSEDRIHFDLIEGKFVPYAEASRNYVNVEISEIWHQLLDNETYEAPIKPLAKAQKNYLLESILDFYKIHIDNFGTVKSLDVLRDVMS